MERQIAVEEAVPGPPRQVPGRVGGSTGGRFFPPPSRGESPVQYLAGHGGLRQQGAGRTQRLDPRFVLPRLQEEVSQSRPGEEIAEAPVERIRQVLEPFLQAPLRLVEPREGQTGRRRERRPAVGYPRQLLPRFDPAPQGPQRQPPIELGGRELA